MYETQFDWIAARTEIQRSAAMMALGTAPKSKNRAAAMKWVDMAKSCRCEQREIE